MVAIAVALILWIFGGFVVGLFFGRMTRLPSDAPGYPAVYRSLFRKHLN